MTMKKKSQAPADAARMAAAEEYARQVGLVRELTQHLGEMSQYMAVYQTGALAEVLAEFCRLVAGDAKRKRPSAGPSPG